MDRDALHGRVDVLTLEGAVTRELFDIAVEQHMAVRQFAPPLGGEDVERADAAVDVEPVVALGGPGGKGDVVKLLLVLGQVLAQRLEHLGAFVKAHLAQVGPAHIARMVEHRLHVEAVVARGRNDFASHGRGDVARAGTRFHPFASGIAGHVHDGHGHPPLRCVFPSRIENIIDRPVGLSKYAATPREDGMSDTVLVDRQDGWVEITLNRPDRLNSFNEDQHLALRAALDAAATDGTRAVLLTGAGKGSVPGRIWATATRARPTRSTLAIPCAPSGPRWCARSGRSRCRWSAR